ncbi:hypothetical protein HFP64_24025 [Bacillus sp. AC79A.1]
MTTIKGLDAILKVETPFLRLKIKNHLHFYLSIGMKIWLVFASIMNLP